MRRWLSTFYNTALESQFSIIRVRYGFNGKMNNDNLSPSSSQNQVQRSREQFPTRYYYVFEVLVVCDVKLTTDDGADIYARKIDLANASDYFNAMFNRYYEKDQDNVILKELDSSALKLIIDFVYSGFIDVTKIDLVVLCSVANYLMFSEITNMCCKQLLRHLSISLCISTRAHFARLNNCSGRSILLEICDTYIIEHMRVVIKCDEFLSLSFEAAEEIIKLIPYDEDNEKQIVTSIISWVNHEWSDRKHLLANLLKYINLPSASKHMIIKGIAEKSDEYTVIDRILRERILRKAAWGQQVILIFGWSLTMSEYFTEWYDLCTGKWNLGPIISGYDKQMSVVVQDGHFVYAFSSVCTSKSAYRLNLSLRPLSWIETKPMYYQRSQLGVVILNGWIYAVGGFDGNHELSEVEAFNVYTKEWEMVSSMSTSRANVGVGVLDNFLYAIGGFGGVSRQHLKSVECYDPIVDGWTPIAEMSVCRSSPGVGVLNGQIYVIGGHDEQLYHKSVEVYNPKTKRWTSIADMHFCRTNPGMSVIVLHGLLYVFGGRSEFNDDNSSIEIYNPYNDKWEYRITSSSGVVNINGGVVVNKFPHFIKKNPCISSSQTSSYSLSLFNGLLELNFSHGAPNTTDDLFFI